MLNLDEQKKAEFFQKNLGGQALWQMLINSGMDKDDVKEVVEFLVNERKEVVAFMGGEQAFDEIDPNWQESLLLLSALRLAVEKNNAFNPRVYTVQPERFVPSAEPVVIG